MAVFPPVEAAKEVGATKKTDNHLFLLIFEWWGHHGSSPRALNDD
jgi:hypothetical protein